MPHCDPEVLSLVALGEQVAPDDHAHLADCRTCHAEVERLRDVVGALRVDVPGPAADGVRPVPPPPSVWAGIAAATGVTSAPRPERIAAATPVATPGATPAGTPATGSDVPTTAPSVEREISPDVDPELTAEVTDDGIGRTGTVRRLPDHRPPASEPRAYRPHDSRPRTSQPRASQRLLLGVAASTLLLGAATGSLVTWQVTRPEPQPQALVIERTTLAPLPAAPRAAGTATVVRTAEGPRLVVNVTDVRPLTGEFYEVWLIDRTVQRMVPVGILHGASGSFTIPEGLDLSDYAVVDISVQTPGDPKHSGHSVLRGIIQA